MRLTVPPQTVQPVPNTAAPCTTGLDHWGFGQGLVMDDAWCQSLLLPLDESPATLGVPAASTGSPLPTSSTDCGVGTQACFTKTVQQVVPHMSAHTFPSTTLSEGNQVIPGQFPGVTPAVESPALGCTCPAWSASHPKLTNKGPSAPASVAAPAGPNGSAVESTAAVISSPANTPEQAVRHRVQQQVLELMHTEVEGTQLAWLQELFTAAVTAPLSTVRTLNQQLDVMLQPMDVMLRPMDVMLQPMGVMLQPMDVMRQPVNVMLQPMPVTYTAQPGPTVVPFQSPHVPPMAVIPSAAPAPHYAHICPAAALGASVLSAGGGAPALPLAQGAYGVPPVSPFLLSLQGVTVVPPTGALDLEVTSSWQPLSSNAYQHVPCQPAASMAELSESYMTGMTVLQAPSSSTTIPQLAGLSMTAPQLARSSLTGPQLPASSMIVPQLAQSSMTGYCDVVNQKAQGWLGGNMQAPLSSDTSALSGSFNSSAAMRQLFGSSQGFDIQSHEASLVPPWIQNTSAAQ